ncbi:hypothetical protein AG1IA_05683 [Rhizoctonia solani AG-1 IA]|uniref:Uncharacterized protein n=1 Tax=Thanatephorus cucumeris (strain AG1-IA) TaxID=983506 RepID=L8WVE7_THACA|nr:hypothetical protein AG1IA_05683 [Rhizoctonia solani AG-1 IA]
MDNALEVHPHSILEPEADFQLTICIPVLVRYSNLYCLNSTRNPFLFHSLEPRSNHNTSRREPSISARSGGYGGIPRLNIASYSNLRTMGPWICINGHAQQGEGKGMEKSRAFGTPFEALVLL